MSARYFGKINIYTIYFHVSWNIIQVQYHQNLCRTIVLVLNVYLNIFGTNLY